MTRHDGQDPQDQAQRRGDSRELGVVPAEESAADFAEHVPQDMADPDVPGPRDAGVPGELENDKMVAESLLRADNDQDAKNVNDAPGFMDGRLGGEDGEVRPGDPALDDARGDAQGGVGAGRSSGFDGGPPRKA